MVVYIWLKIRDKDISEKIEQIRKRAVGSSYELKIYGQHWFLEHEHGIIIFVNLGNNGTFCRDVSNCADDPLDTPVNNALDNRNVLGTWSWWSLNGPNSMGEIMFETTGKPINKLERDWFFTTAEAWSEFINTFHEDIYNEMYVSKRDFHQIKKTALEIEKKYSTH